MEAFRKLEEVSDQIETVFSVGIISRVDDDWTIPAARVMEAEGIKIRPSGETTLNLGRAL